ncbi:hypothetical protein Tco_1092554, partial [Tanacetum coccineum]
MQTEQTLILGNNAWSVFVRKIMERHYGRNRFIEGQLSMGTFIQTPAEETEGALQLGPERARVFTDLSAEEKERYKADIRATNILLQGITKKLHIIKPILTLKEFGQCEDGFEGVTMSPLDDDVMIHPEKDLDTSMWIHIFEVEQFMTNHKPVVVHDSEETLEIAELTRKRMYEKMKSPQCIQNKVKFAPPDYSKENYLAIFAPQRDLTPEQIFWAKDENDKKKVEASVLKPLSTPTVYPPNTPVKLVPRVLPTKSQVKINLYTLTQLFTEFDKTCKKRITPTGLTEGERGFEQTKRCYLTEVIPFFKTLKQHFEGVQKALFKEVKRMEEIFDQMSAEVDQNTIDKQYLEAEISKLQNENQKDVNDEMIR